VSDITLTINGETRSASCPPETTLLKFLRENLNLTGAKLGCDVGDCGACTVIVDGQRINSCLTLAVMHDGDSITTIEGLGTPENLSPVQQAFIDCGGFQCGICTPGQIVATTALLNENAKQRSPGGPGAESRAEHCSASHAQLRVGRGIIRTRLLRV
jgi:xanthine dehydrogenase YagT iron-sulfur-binding subunit